jgi:hypothetical protein
MTSTFVARRATERIPPIHERAQPPPKTADNVGGWRSILTTTTTRTDMLISAFPFLLPKNIERELPAKLRALASDLEGLSSRAAPADAILASAPLLVDWRGVLTPMGLRLSGFVAGHPLLGNHPALTSQVWAADAEGQWIRTLSRYYRLGVPAGAHLLASGDKSGDHASAAGERND